MWAPDTASYGYDSRAASIRILSAPGVPLSATRFEVRVPGADVSHSFSSLILWTLLLDGYFGGDQGSTYGPIIAPF
jgi:glutamine synthetase